MQIYAKSKENIEMKKSRSPHKCVVSRPLTESDRRGSNPRSRPWQGRALPTTPLSHIMTVTFQNSHYFTLFTVCCQSFFIIARTFPVATATNLPCLISFFSSSLEETMGVTSSSLEGSVPCCA